MDRIFSAILVLQGILWASKGVSISYPTPVDFTHELLKWPTNADNPVVSYRVISEYQDDYDRFIDTISRAANMWGGIGASSLALSWTQNDQNAQITLHLQSSINDSSFSAGYAEFDELGDDGEPLHCSIFVLISQSFSYTSIAKTILHEFGHCLGLGHSLIPEAIMSYHLDKNSFRLDLDDIAAIVRLYPQQGGSQVAPGCGIGIVSHRKNRYLLLLLLAFPLVLSLLHRVVKLPFNNK
ncbi:MAG: matrixin family metalloprotease [Oligoflexales bacterium]